MSFLIIFTLLHVSICRSENIDITTIPNTIHLEDFLNIGLNEDGSLPSMIYNRVVYIKEYICNLN